MLQRDHIMRQIQQATQVVQRLLGLREDEQYQQAQKEVDEVLDELLDLGPDGEGSPDLSHLSEEQIIDRCKGADGTLSTDLAVALAELLEQRELISAELGDEEIARVSRRFALTLYERSMAQEDAVLPLNRSGSGSGTRTNEFDLPAPGRYPFESEAGSSIDRTRAVHIPSAWTPERVMIESPSLVQHANFSWTR